MILFSILLLSIELTIQKSQAFYSIKFQTVSNRELLIVGIKIKIFIKNASTLRRARTSPHPR